jgi:hypothetical protein
MKAQGHRARRISRAKRKVVRKKAGPLMIIFLLIITVVVGAIAISVNIRVEEWEKTHYSGDGDH